MAVGKVKCIGYAVAIRVCIGLKVNGANAVARNALNQSVKVLLLLNGIWVKYVIQVNVHDTQIVIIPNAVRENLLNCFQGGFLVNQVAVNAAHGVIKLVGLTE